VEWPLERRTRCADRGRKLLEAYTFGRAADAIVRACRLALKHRRSCAY
jgi:hypothetical protein